MATDDVKSIIYLKANLKKRGRKPVKDKIKARSVPFSRTRSRHASETAEDYVEAVMELIEEQGECRVLDLALYFNVSHVTVSRIVKRLQDENLLHSKPYKPVELTAKGSKLAKQVKERHEVVLDFLIKLGVDKANAEIDSEGIEHHVGSKTLAAMKRFLK
jgi:DtxR family manganese transport transcriptional regulator